MLHHLLLANGRNLRSLFCSLFFLFKREQKLFFLLLLLFLGALLLPLLGILIFLRGMLFRRLHFFSPFELAGLEEELWFLWAFNENWGVVVGLVLGFCLLVGVIQELPNEKFILVINFDSYLFCENKLFLRKLFRNLYI